MAYAKKVNRTKNQTPQNIKAREDQVLNDAGGYTFKIDNWNRLNRFLILGSDKNQYYVDSKTLTNQNYENIIECLKEDANRTIDIIVNVSHEGRAPKNAPAVFALAVCAAFGDNTARQQAFRRMPEVARIATDFFSFVDQYKTLGGGFGTVARKGIQAWYQNKDISDAAYQIIKYPNRNKWTHLDVLRLSHVKPASKSESNLYAFAKSLAGKESSFDVDVLPNIAQGYLKAKSTNKVSDLVKIINDYRLPREAIPNEFLNEKDVWMALLPHMPATALIRNLGKLTSVGVIDTSLSEGTNMVAEKLANEQWLQKSRIHPIVVLNALSVYNNGSSILGKLSWKPVRKVSDALDSAFYSSFKYLEPTGKVFNLALDVSGSMSCGTTSFSLTPREITAAMAMATARVEDNYIITGFTGGSQSVDELTISPTWPLSKVVKSISNLPFGRTDCAAPMLWAKQKGLDIDCFVVYTDNETWCGNTHPFEAMKQYRNKHVNDSKLIVCATTASSFSIADPNDPGMLDIAGFDSTVPNIIAQFAKGV